MKNIGCYGTEDKLTDCAYIRGSNEDTHSDDIWIDCSAESDDVSAIEWTDRKLMVALIALTVSLLTLAIVVGYIMCTRQSKCRKRYVYVHHSHASVITGVCALCAGIYTLFLQTDYEKQVKQEDHTPSLYLS